MVSAEMAHTTHDKKKLLNRIKRIRGQLNSVEKALEEDRDCGDVLLAHSPPSCENLR